MEKPHQIDKSQTSNYISQKGYKGCEPSHDYKKYTKQECYTEHHKEYNTVGCTVKEEDASYEETRNWEEYRYTYEPSFDPEIK